MEDTKFVKFSIPSILVEATDDKNYTMIAITMQMYEDLVKRVEEIKRDQSVSKARIVGKAPTVLVEKHESTH